MYYVDLILFLGKKSCQFLIVHDSIKIKKQIVKSKLILLLGFSNLDSF